MIKSLDLAKLCKSSEWSGGIKLVVQGAMRSPVIDGSVELQASWRIDIYETRANRKPLVTLVCKPDETPADLFRQLADFYEAGELLVKPAS